MDLVTSVSLPVSSSPATINVNVLFPRDLYLLRRLVLSKAKDKKNNFIIFMLDGCINVRVKGKEQSTPIYVAADLNDFLGKFSATRSSKFNS